MRRAPIQVLLLAASLVLAPSASSAQEPLHILTYAPRDIARPTDVITVTFDRSVTGMVEHSVDPSGIVRIEPTIKMRIEWRDPSTIRIVPLEPLFPGRRYAITIDTGFTAIDGSRLAAPARLAIAVRGPALVGMSPALWTTQETGMSPTGRLTLSFSAPVADSLLEHIVRIAIRTDKGTCRTNGTFAYHVVRHRAPRSDDSWELSQRAGQGPDGSSLRFRDIVEMAPDDSLPQSCRGDVYVPSLDSLDAAEIRFPVRTARAFGRIGIGCEVECPTATFVGINFDAPVAPELLLASVHFDPPASFMPKAPPTPMSSWRVAAKLTPHTTYRVTVDSSLHDIYGRRMAFGFDTIFTTTDRIPDFGYQSGLVLRPGNPVPFIRVRHVNVDSVTLLMMPVPDTDRVHQTLRPVPKWRDGYRTPFPDSILRVVALPAPINEERVTDIPLPELSGRLFGQLVALQTRLHAATRRIAVAPPAKPAKLISDFQYTGGTPNTLLEATDLIAHARLSMEGGVVWVTSARTARPVRGATVSALDTAGHTVATATTDDRGMAVLAFAEGTPRPPLLDVRLGPDRSLTDLRGRWPGDVGTLEVSSAFDRGFSRPGQLTHAFVFTDRGIYRPGEPVSLGAAIRYGPLGAMTAPPPGDSVRVHVGRYTSDDDARVVRDTVLRLSPFGTLAYGFRLGPEAPLGNYWFEVSLMRNMKWQAIGGTSLRVAEYRAPEFLVAASADSTTRFRGDSIVARISGNYLFGAPMARAVVQWSAEFNELGASDFTIPGFGREWEFGDQPPWWTPRAWTMPVSAPKGVDTLDAAGVLNLKIPTDAVVVGRGSNARVDVSVIDLNRQIVTASVHSIVHPSAFYIALRDTTTGWWWPLNTPHSVRVMAVRPDGHAVEGVRVRVAVVAYEWKPEAADEDGATKSPWHTDTVRVDTLVTESSPRSLALPALKEGPVQVVATAIDEKARAVRTTMARWVYGRAAIAGSSPLQLPLHLEHDRLKPGETAVARFTSPWAMADAWVTTEREGVISERVLRGVHGSVTVRFPMTEREVPNVFVSVVLLRRATLGAADSLVDRMRIGYAALRVDDASKRLAVRLRTTRTDYSPGDSATIELTVRDARQRKTPAEVTLWAVDEGVLALTGYRTPDPMSFLYAPVRDGVAFASTLRSLPGGLPPWIWRRSQSFEWENDCCFLRVVMGSDGAPYVVGAPGVDGQQVPRIDFRATAFFRAGVRTDSNGVARISVKLPDNVTTFRVMAVAVGAGDRYGSATTPLLVTKPLIVRAALPRFIRANDSVFAGAVVSGRDRSLATSRMIDVTAAGKGVALTSAPQVKTTLGAGGTEVRFAWSGVAGDSARFHFGATDGTHSDAVVVSIPVKPDQTPRARTLTGMVRDSGLVELRLPRNIDGSKSRLTIRTGTSPVPALRVAHDFLLAGSYGCNEQLAAVGRMLVSLLTLERSGVKVLDDTLSARDELRHIAAEFAHRYHDAGFHDCWGFSWAASPVHAEANLVLLDIRDAGIAVDSSMVRGLSKTFVRLLDSLPLFPDTTYGGRTERQSAIANRLQARVGAVAFLRRTGMTRQRDLDLLREHSSRLTWEDRVWLAELLEQAGDHANARALLDQLWATLGDAGNRVDVPDSVLTTVGFPSHIRPVARLLNATLLIAPDHPRLGALVERLTSRTRVERDEWWNTQDHVAATVALSAFTLDNPGRNGTLTVRSATALAGSGRKPIALQSGTETPRDTTVELGDFVNVVGDSAAVTLRLKVSGGPQYYAITISEIDKERPTSPDIRGITVERWYERFDDGRTVTELLEGDLVRVRLRVTAPSSRDFVAVEDILPSGLEAVDLTLRTSGTLGPFVSTASDAAARQRNADAGGTPDGELYGSWYGGWWSPWGQPQQHDDRTVFFARKLWTGSFTLSYIARATTAGRFVRPQAHAEELYNAGVNGRSEGGWFDVRSAASPEKP
jgi:alpha-2-macroglobulin